jgi:uncharacterized membrane protein YsdA (DUF1294 family)/cold shock CspA family protein
MRSHGKITHWNEEKGYGFISPSSGTNKIFVHICAFKNRHLLPELDQVVLYALSTDKQGRPCAVKVVRAGEDLPGNAKTFSRRFLMLFLVGFIVVVGWSVTAHNIPIQILYLYLATSAFTFLIYAKDKWSARTDRWRIKESTLHTLAFVGGWPGALIAQQVLRHKSWKNSFKFVFWATVVFNCAGFGLLFTANGAEMLRALRAFT